MLQYDIFLSYETSSEDKARLVELKASHLGLRVFLARERLRPGDSWEEEIRQALLASRELAFLATAASINRPWVLTECAGHWLLGRVVTPILCDVEASQIEQHFRRHQAVKYDRVDDYLREAVARKSSSTLLTGGPLADCLAQHQKDVQVALVAETVVRAPYRTDRFLVDAQDRVFVAGQNLYTLLIRNIDQTRKLLDEFLEQGDQRRVDFLLNDPEFKEGVEAWSKAGNSPAFARDLDKSITAVEKLVHDYQGRGHNVNARVTNFVGVSASFMDPDGPNGRMSLLPNTWQPRALLKTCFMLSKADNPHIFDVYWENYSLAFEHARALGGA